MRVTDILRKYARPTPRYTSYPTVPVWTNTVTAHDYKNLLASLTGSLSLYFHLPFCENQCHYCGCSRVVTTDHSQSLAYTKTLAREIELIDAAISTNSKFKIQNSKQMAENSKEKNSKQEFSILNFEFKILNFDKPVTPRITQIHFGGGSPNFFQPSEISTIMQAVRKHFSVTDNAEMAIEINPRPNLEKFYDNLAREGFNRISLGVQDFDDNVQKQINRFQTFDITQSAINYLRSLGIKQINFDLVCGLPGQTVSTFMGTLKKTVELSPSRIALYAYAHLPWTFPFQRSFDEKDLPSTDTRIEIYEAALNFFSHHGYHAIGMDHFAKEDDELFIAFKNKTLHRNFMGYTTKANAHQIGLGMTGISCVNGNYFQNAKDLGDYVRAIDSGTFATRKGHLASRDDVVRRGLIQALMCQQRINIPAFEQKFDLDFKKYFEREIPLLRTFVDDQLLKVSDAEITVVPPGHLVLRNIAACFDGYLKNTPPPFSKTI